MSLEDYKARRSFETTPEPKPGPGHGRGDLIFVVHKHAARALHYDLRLELEGVLKSWAIPKGPSFNPAEKRLAVMVEDHPFEYKDFEGVIPEGNYGAGSVIIWDRGHYRHPSAGDREESERFLLEGLKKGDMKFVLAGEKLRGEFALVRTRKDEKSWLLLKKKDQHAAAQEVLTQNRSVLSRRTLEDVSETEEPHRPDKIGQIRIAEMMEGKDLLDAPVTPMPHNIRPMLATPASKPFDHPDWLFEMKWDGYRATAELRSDRVSLYSRNLISLNHRFPALVDSLRKFRFQALLDGEIVVVDDRGHPDFQLLQDYQKSGKGHLLYYVFDILHLQEHDVTQLPLVRRKEILKRILPSSQKVKLSNHINTEGILFFSTVEKEGLEGIIAKRAQSTYSIGRRTREWLKIKTRLTQKGVIAGFSAPRGGRRNFGALVLGAYKGDELTFIGHVGGGFNARTLTEIRAKLDPLIRDKSPFRVEPRTNTSVTWVEPELVCEVVFHGWTAEGMMRQPVFLRLREDKVAREVAREESL